MKRSGIAPPAMPSSAAVELTKLKSIAPPPNACTILARGRGEELGLEVDARLLEPAALFGRSTIAAAGARSKPMVSGAPLPWASEDPGAQGAGAPRAGCRPRWRGIAAGIDAHCLLHALSPPLW